MGIGTKIVFPETMLLKRLVFISLMLFAGKLTLAQELSVCPSPDGQKVGLCRDFKAVTSFSYDSIRMIADSFFMAYSQGKTGVLDARPQLIVDPAWERVIYLPTIKRFLTVNGDRYALIDSLGEEAVGDFRILRYYKDSTFTPYSQVDTLDLSYEYIVLMHDGKPGIIDRRGLDIFRPVNDYTWMLRKKDGSIGSYVTKYKTQFYIYNEIFLPYKVFYVEDVTGMTEDWRLLTEKKGQLQVTDFSGNPVNYLREQVIYAENTDGYFGLITTNGAIVLPFECEFIERTVSGDFRVYRDGNVIYYDASGQKMAEE